MKASPPPRRGPGDVSPPPADRLRFSRRLAVLLDDLVPIPGTRQAIGADAVIGLVPGIGDLVGSGLSGAVMIDAVRMHAPIPTLARMGLNVVVDALLGLVPFAGDLLDLAHRANRKNYRLLLAAVERQIASGAEPGPPTVGYLAAAIALVVLPLAFSLVLGIVMLVLLVRWLL